MAIKEEYDVMRMIEHNQACYVSTEYVKGKTLPQWIKYHPCAEKKKFLQMVDSITGQLSQIHRCRGNPCYRYVNPYSIIVSEEERVYFLDINAKSNAGQLRTMKRRTVREYFLPPDEPYYQRESIELDIYGLGRTLQYLLSETDMDPPLNRSEEAKFQKIISRCINRHSKKPFQSVIEIQRMIPKYRQSKKEKKARKRHGRAVITIMMILGFAGVIIGGGAAAINSINSVKERLGQQNSLQEEKAQTANKRNELNESVTESISAGTNEERLSMELGTIYFLEFKNYEKSREYFGSVKDSAFAENMAVIAECFAGDRTQEEKLRQALLDAETEIGKQDEKQIGEKQSYYRCILKGYTVLEKSEDFQNLLRLGEICLQDDSKEETAEILGYMAFAHEGLGEIKEAADMYEEQLKYEEDDAAREEIYKKTAALLIQSGENGQAQEMLRTGIKETGDSAELRMAYVTALLGDASLERQLCIQNIQEQLKEMPELKEQEEFKKLMRQNGINVEGDKVW